MHAKWLNLLLIVLCVSVNDAKLDSNKKGVHFSDLNWIKRDLFLNIDINNRSLGKDYEDVWQCLAEVNMIKEGLQKSELWALKRKF